MPPRSEKRTRLASLTSGEYRTSREMVSEALPDEPAASTTTLASPSVDGAANGIFAVPDAVIVPTGVTIFPKDLVPAPRQFAERFFPIVRWTELPAGGHFTAWEEPPAFARELTALARDVVSQVSDG